MEQLILISCIVLASSFGTYLGIMMFLFTLKIMDWIESNKKVPSNDTSNTGF